MPTLVLIQRQISLHIGNLVQVMSLVHLQRCGHKPIALVGGATGLVGDPSGKSNERDLLDEATIKQNIRGVTTQLKKILNFEGDNGAEVVNNQDWFKEFQFLILLEMWVNIFLSIICWQKIQ